MHCEKGNNKTITSTNAKLDGCVGARVDKLVSCSV